MKKKYLIIDAYINNVCKKVYSRHIRREIKEELYSHLLEHYDRQIALGKSDEEAQKIAVSFMGDSQAVSDTFEKLYKGTEKLISETVWSLFTGNLCALLFFIIEDSQMIYLALGFALQLISLYLLRKINKKFKTAAIIVCSNLIFTELSSILYNYFSLPLEFKYIVCVASGLAACVVHALVFMGIRAVEKQLCDTKKSELSPVISIILMIVTQIFAASTVFFESGYGFFYLLICCATGAFPMVMLIGHGIDILEGFDWNISETYAEDKKIRRVFVLVWVAIIFISPLAAVNRPAKTVDFTIQDIKTEVNMTEIRENIVALGLPEKIVNELPDSELLKYKDAERIEVNSDDDAWATDLTYDTYAIYLPENDLQPERVRILFIISGFDVHEKTSRSGIYINTDMSTTSEFEYDLKGYDCSFMQILCEINGETKQTVPFYQKDLTSRKNLKYPIGCDYGYPKGSENHRIYAAQTVIPAEDEEYIDVGYSYYYDYSFLTYENTVEKHRESSFSARDFIDADFKNPNYIEPEDSDKTGYDALNKLLENLSEYEDLSLSELESALEEDFGQDVDSELLENMVNQITDEVSNP